MLTIFTRRFIQLLFVLWGVSTLIFFLQRLVPGSPADAVLGPDAADADKLIWLARYGLDKPLLSQYISFFKDLFHGSLGYSYRSYTPVVSIILPRFVETLKLAFVAFLFSLIVAGILGVWSAARQNQGVDKFLALLSLVTVSAPSFVMGPALLWLFSLHWDIFPLMGYEEGPRGYVLPCATLGASLAALTSRLIRSGLVDVLNEDYIRTAKSKGLSTLRILLVHALRNALLPTLTVLGMQLGVLLGGTVITEQIFNWPGMGSLVVEAVQQREYNIVSGCVLCMATTYVLCNLTVDLLARALDPRLRIS